MLCVISLLLLVVRLNISHFIKPTEIEIGNLKLAVTELDKKYLKHTNNQKAWNPNLNLFPFNPNTVSENELVDLGLKPKTAKTFIKFRSSGFIFRSKEDVKKIYGITPELYNKLEPYIIISNLGHNKLPLNSVHEKTNKTKTKIDLNTADSLALIDLQGVGPSFAKRILKYKAMLGGYSKIEQLHEVYGMTDELYLKLSEQVKLQDVQLQKININTCDFKLLMKHPYFNYELTKHICNTRKLKKISPENLLEIIQDEILVQKIKPYIEF